MKEYVGIYIKTEKSTGTRLGCCLKYHFHIKHHFHITTAHKSLCFAFTLAIYTYVGMNTML